MPDPHADLLTAAKAAAAILCSVTKHEGNLPGIYTAANTTLRIVRDAIAAVEAAPDPVAINAELVAAAEAISAAPYGVASGDLERLNDALAKAKGGIAPPTEPSE